MAQCAAYVNGHKANGTTLQLEEWFAVSLMVSVHSNFLSSRWHFVTSHQPESNRVQFLSAERSF